MARARNIKPGFFTNDVLAEVDPLGRILFAGLWTIADREGRLEDRPKKIKAQVLPYDECSCDSLLQDLHKHGFIQRYSLDGNGYIQIVKWSEHQNPHVKETESTIPAPDKNGASPVLSTTQTGTSRADSLNPITDSLNPITDSAPKQVATASPKSRRPNKVPLPNDFGISDRVRAWAGEKGFTRLEAHFENFVSACRKAGYVYADWDEAFMDAVRKDWAKLSQPQARASPAYQTKQEQTRDFINALTGNRHEQRTPSADIIDIEARTITDQLD